MNGVVVQEQALAETGLELQVFGAAVAIDLKLAARFDAGQHTHQTLSDAVFSSDVASDVLLTRFGRCQVADRSASRHGLRQRRGFQSLADLLDVRAEVLEQDVVAGQVVLHASGVCDGPQRAAKHQSVKARQHSRNLVLVIGDKLHHGVSALRRSCVALERSTSYEGRNASVLVAATPRCGTSTRTPVSGSTHWQLTNRSTTPITPRCWCNCGMA